MALAELRERYAELLNTRQKLNDTALHEDRDLSEAEQVTFDEAGEESEALRKRITRAETVEREQTFKNESAGRMATPNEPNRANPNTYADQHPDEWYDKLRTGGLVAFNGKAKDAYVAGQWLRANCLPHTENESARKWWAENGRQYVQTEGVPSAGGNLVPTPLSSAIIDLREEYGVFRRESQREPMTSDTIVVPKRESGVTAYLVGETAETTASDSAWSNVTLIAKELAALTRVSRSLAEDAIVDLADRVAVEMAYAFALKEDQCGFIGDGTATYGGMHGTIVKVDDGNHAGGLTTSLAGNIAFSSLDLADFEEIVGDLPQYAVANAKWYISRVGYFASMARLMNAAGGNTALNLAAGSPEMFLGHPVVFSQVLNSTTTDQVSTTVCLFGDLRLAAKFGDRRGISVESTTDRYFEFRQIGIQATERFDINSHSLGTATVSGPIRGLKTPAA